VSNCWLLLLLLVEVGVRGDPLEKRGFVGVLLFGLLLLFGVILAGVLEGELKFCCCCWLGEPFGFARLALKRRKKRKNDKKRLDRGKNA
jgi:hypothetical protein